MNDLTKRQKQVFDWILDQPKRPTLREIGAQFEITVKGAHDHVQALIRKGALEQGEAKKVAFVIPKKFRPDAIMVPLYRGGII